MTSLLSQQVANSSQRGTKWCSSYYSHQRSEVNELFWSRVMSGHQMNSSQLQYGFTPSPAGTSNQQYCVSLLVSSSDTRHENITSVESFFFTVHNSTKVHQEQMDGPALLISALRRAESDWAVLNPIDWSNCECVKLLRRSDHPSLL